MSENSETEMIPTDEPFVPRSPQNFPGEMSLQRPTTFINSDALRHDGNSLPVTSPGTMVPIIQIPQITASASAILHPARNSSESIHSPSSHEVTSHPFVGSMHGPVHTGIRSFAGPEVLHEDRRTGMLQEGRQSLTEILHHFSWYPQVEAVDSSATAALQS